MYKYLLGLSKEDREGQTFLSVIQWQESRQRAQIERQYILFKCKKKTFYFWNSQTLKQVQVESPSLKILKTHLNMELGNQFCVALSEQGSWTG